MIKSILLTLIFTSTPIVALAQASCVEMFIRSTLQETLIAEMGELEITIQERLQSEADPLEQTLLSTQLVEVDSLINDTLSTPAINQFRLQKYAVALEEIKAALNHDSASKKVATSFDGGLKLQVIQSPEAQIASRNLTDFLAKKYLSFLNEVETIDSVQKLSALWNLERFNVWAELSRAGYIVQLGGGHFVFFTVEPAQTIAVRAFYDKRPVPPPIDEALR